MPRPSGPVCAQDLLENLRQFHDKNDVSPARDSAHDNLEKRGRSLPKQPSRQQHSEYGNTDNKPHQLTDNMTSTLLLRDRQAHDLHDLQSPGLEVMITRDKLNDIQALSTCRYATTLLLTLLLGVIIGVIACCHFMEVECRPSQLLLTAF